mmetsp:Transcript_99199/g.265294  ORF Transcript_99199/g.265294 Transcript_99199/m.265294 type:complete len:279 (+) Transcript_99199:721-1557(+)
MAFCGDLGAHAPARGDAVPHHGGPAAGRGGAEHPVPTAAHRHGLLPADEHTAYQDRVCEQDQRARDLAGVPRLCAMGCDHRVFARLPGSGHRPDSAGISSSSRHPGNRCVGGRIHRRMRRGVALCLRFEILDRVLLCCNRISCGAILLHLRLDRARPRWFACVAHVLHGRPLPGRRREHNAVSWHRCYVAECEPARDAGDRLRFLFDPGRFVEGFRDVVCFHDCPVCRRPSSSVPPGPHHLGLLRLRPCPDLVHPAPGRGRHADPPQRRCHGERGARQ